MLLWQLVRSQRPYAWPHSGASARACVVLAHGLFLVVCRHQSVPKYGGSGACDWQTTQRTGARKRPLTRPKRSSAGLQLPPPPPPPLPLPLPLPLGQPSRAHFDAVIEALVEEVGRSPLLVPAVPLLLPAAPALCAALTFLRCYVVSRCCGSATTNTAQTATHTSCSWLAADTFSVGGARADVIARVATH
jgi:hypothetical protein